MSRKVLPLIVAGLLLIAGPALAQKGAAPAHAGAPQASSEALTPEQARRALETLQDDAKRAQMIETLRAIAKTTPANDKTALTSAKTAPANTPPAAASDAAKPDAKPDAAAEKPALPTLNSDSL
ncbi:MAG: hypothetical protein J0H25_12460, partial [Rhizobiales bacterium]|nr:hypothetical protein [Hyphomicrobiales bacterium]